MQPMTYSDSELLARFLSGCEDSFGKLVERHEGKVFALALSLLGSSDLAEAALVKVFSRAYCRPADSLKSDSILIWLSRLTLAASAEIRLGQEEELSFKSLEVLREEGNSQARESFSDSTGNPTNQLFDFVRRLPYDCRCVFGLRDIVGLSLREISELLSMPQEQISLTLHRTRLMLRRWINRSLDSKRRDILSKNPNISVVIQQEASV